MSIRAIVFDLDDTLYLERDFAFSGFRAVCKQFDSSLGNAGKNYSRCVELFDGPHRSRVFNQLVSERLGKEDLDLVTKLVEAFRSHRPVISLQPDADRALKNLRGRFRIGLITDGPSVTQWNKIDALGLRARIDEIIVTNDLLESDARAVGLGESSMPNEGSVGAGRERGYGKPHPLAYVLMAKRLGVNHAECVYVADNVGKDFIAPNALGWLTVMVRREGALYGESQPCEGGEPSHTLRDLDQLATLLSSPN